MKPLHKRFSALVLITSLMSLCLTQTGCQRTLAPEGVYKGDRILFEAENTIFNAHSLLQTFVTWEADNRESLATIPDIKQFADRIYTEGPKWFKNADAVLEIYRNNPTGENRDNLQLAIDLLRSVTREASSYLTKASAVQKKTGSLELVPIPVG